MSGRPFRWVGACRHKAPPLSSLGFYDLGATQVVQTVTNARTPPTGRGGLSIPARRGFSGKTACGDTVQPFNKSLFPFWHPAHPVPSRYRKTSVDALI